MKISAIRKFAPQSIAYLLLLCANVSTAGFFDKWPEIPPPPQAEVAWVAEDMTQNGVPMKIKTFSSRLSKKAIVEFYRAAWSKGSGPKPAVNEGGAWTVVGTIDGGYVLTAQVKDRENNPGSEGFLAISTLIAAAKMDAIRTDTKFPRLSGTQMLSDTRSSDSGRRGKTLIMKNHYSVETNASFYIDKLKADGWSIDPIAATHQQSTINSKYLYFTRSNESITMTITKQKTEMGSSILVNISNISV